MKRELDHLANFLQAAVDYKKNGFRAYNRNLPFYSSRRLWYHDCAYATKLSYGPLNEARDAVIASYGTVMGGLLSDKFLDTNTSV
uniref:Uncharacterized protein n=1 Tax=Oryza nivara TaxID=4536 RepID=A0A0E0IIF3_ORYNI